MQLSETLGDVLLAAGFSEMDERFSRCLLTMGTHATKASESLARIAQGCPARQVRVVRVGSKAEPAVIREAKTPSVATMERVRAILAGVPDSGILNQLAATDESSEASA
jgi:hypothetical protein